MLIALWPHHWSRQQRSNATLVAALVLMVVMLALLGQILSLFPEPIGSNAQAFSDGARTTLWLTLISAWPFPLLAWVSKRPAFKLFWREQWRLGLAVGFCVLFSYALVLWAMQLGSIAEAAALREISVILVVLFGMRYLKEPFGRPRLIACGLVLIGMLVMKL